MNNQQNEELKVRICAIKTSEDASEHPLDGIRDKMVALNQILSSSTHLFENNGKRIDRACWASGYHCSRIIVLIDKSTDFVWCSDARVTAAQFTVILVHAYETLQHSLAIVFGQRLDIADDEIKSMKQGLRDISDDEIEKLAAKVSLLEI